MYDYLIVGAGQFGSVFAQILHKNGKKCLLIDKRNDPGGNLYSKEEEGIRIHLYGAHIFHTDNKDVWKYINRFTEFNHYVNSPLAHYKGRLYNLPFNMNTFNKLWGVNTPEEARKKIEEQCRPYQHITHPANLEEHALKLCGDDIYYTFIKEYTEKQWGCSARDLPSFIIKRIPFHFVYDNNYFDDPYQGNAVVNYNERAIPYTRIIEHKHFEFGKQPVTIITREYPQSYTEGKEPYYPINDERNMKLAEKYKEIATSLPNVLFGGRLGQYAYFDMDDTIASAIELAKKELSLK